ncbi:hypothetical protein [Palleronia marisminoris]|nr:hypothetical protein [Palleronia marisminoris]
MQRRSSSAVLAIAAVAGGIGFVVFTALLIVVGVTISPALFLALVVAATVAAFLLLRADRGAEATDDHADSARSEPGTAGVPVTEAAPATLGTERAGEGSDSDGTAVAPVGAASPEGAAVSDASAGPNRDDAGDAVGSAPSAGTGGLSGTDSASDAEGETGATDAPSTTETAGDEDGAGTRLPTEEIVEATDSSEDSAPTNDPEEDAPNDAIGRPPARLDAPREGGADDLKRIRGVGPKLEETLNGIGIYHLDQIAGWSTQELAWIDEHLEGFKGRASRDAWVEQARELSEADA